MKKIVLLFISFSFLFAGIVVENGTTYVYETKKLKNAKIKMDKKEIRFIPHPKDINKSVAFIPFHYKSKLGIKKAKVYSGGKLVKTLSFDVKKGDYKQEKLTVAKKHVNPPKKVLKRISREYKEAMKIYRSFSDKALFSGEFIEPMSSVKTSAFGNARVFNGELKSYHSGVDYRARIGSDVKAVNSGKVVLIGDRYYAGGSVVIDHGYGVYSCYFHLSDFKVKVGDLVKKGELIALSGNTGRSTGPHLHLSIRVNGTTVSPLDFMKKFNKLVASY